MATQAEIDRAMAEARRESERRRKRIAAERRKYTPERARAEAAKSIAKQAAKKATDENIRETWWAGIRYRDYGMDCSRTRLFYTDEVLIDSLLRAFYWSRYKSIPVEPPADLLAKAIDREEADRKRAESRARFEARFGRLPE